MIAGGNSGPKAFSIDTPGSTPAALTVGAIDREDQITSFSSRGPLPDFAGYAIKPDITGPGWDIMSTGASTGSETGGALYLRAGGTSMASPHVAAAAAILLQRHPDWSGEQLKSALMGTARINTALNVFEQGAGRVDVPAAAAALVTSQPQSLSLGFADFPHEDDPIVTATATFRNETEAPQSLSLQLDMKSPDGATPPAGMFVIDRTTLTLPVGGTGTVTVTANTRLPAAVGWFEGKLLATTSGRTLSVPVAIHREEPMYNLVLRHIDRNGGDSEHYRTTFVPIDRCLPVFPQVEGVKGDVTVRVPAGRYAVQSHFRSNVQTEPSTLLLYGNYPVYAGASLTLDARNSTLVANTLPTSTAVSHWARTQYEASIACGSHSFSLEWAHDSELGEVRMYSGYLGEPAEHIRGYISEQWLDPAQANATDAPASYAASFSAPGVLVAAPKTIPAGRMSSLRARYAQTLGSTQGSFLNISVDTPGLHPNNGPYVSLPLPAQRMEYYYSSDPNVRWRTDLWTFGLSLAAPSLPYKAGETHFSRWNEPPFAPALLSYNPEVPWSYRVGDAMTVELPLLSDRHGHAGTVPVDDERGDVMTSTLYRNGEQIGRVSGSCSTCASHRVVVPPELATYRLEAQVKQQTLPWSTSVLGTWTFQSQHSAGGETARLPLLTVQYMPRLNESGAAARSAAFRMPVSVRQLNQPGFARVRDLAIDASFDDGVTWQRVRLERSDKDWTAVVNHPQAGAYVSLRARVTGLSANSAEITVIRAYALTDSQ